MLVREVHNLFWLWDKRWKILRVLWNCQYKTVSLLESTYKLGHSCPEVSVKGRCWVCVYFNQFWIRHLASPLTHVDIQSWPDEIRLRQILLVPGLSEKSYINDGRVLASWIMRCRAINTYVK